MIRLRLLLLALVAALALTSAACGGSDDDAASAQTDVDTLLEQTFTGEKRIESGKLDMALRIDGESGESGFEGPVTVSLKGPFESQGAGKVPKFKLDAAFEGAGQSITAGATSTGEKGFLTFQGTDYVLEAPIFAQFKAGFEEAQKQGAAKDGQSVASLGMDPRKWLTDAKNEGEATVGEEKTIKITGGVDVARLLDDVNRALEKVASLGGQAGQVPEKLTAKQRQQAIDSVKDPKVEIYTGKEDKILRRLAVNMGVADKASGSSGTFSLEIALIDLNGEQEIDEPSDAKPFSQLLSQLGGLGLGGGSGSGSGSGSGESQQNLEQYSQCLNEAGEDAEKARKCADLLAG
jgi:hypothetical protein